MRNPFSRDVRKDERTRFRWHARGPLLVLLAISIVGFAAPAIAVRKYGPAWATPGEPTAPPSPRARATESRAPAPSAARLTPTGSFPQRILASVVGIRATLPTPRLHFRGRSKVVADAEPSGGTGTGIIVDPKGVILTCAHLVDRAIHVRVFLPDDREVTGKVLVIDPTSDLALLSVDAGPLAPLDLQPAASLKSGARVHLASRPGGATIRFEAGELAAPGTYHLGHSQLEFFRRFTGSISPGDSGGALIDSEGHFVGLVSVGHPAGDLGYAIAREFVLVALARLRSGPPVVWPWLGVGVETPADGDGVLAWTVAAGSPADLAGLKPGDRIVTIDGQQADHFLPAMLRIISRPVGTRFKLGIARAGDGTGGASEPKSITLISSSRPIDPVLPPLDLFQRLTGIRLAYDSSKPNEPAGLRVRALPSNGNAAPYAIGSRLIAIVPGAGLVHALEEGKSDQEIRVSSVEDLGHALRASFEGPHVAAALIWSTHGKLETMLLSGDANQYPLL